MHAALVPLLLSLLPLQAVALPGLAAQERRAQAQGQLQSREATRSAREVRASGSLPFFYDLYTFRGEGGRTTVLAAFAVPVEELRKEDADDGVRYRFDVSFVLSDTARHRVTRTDDSVFVRVPDPLAGKHLLHTHVELETPPSGTTLQRVVMLDATTPGVGQLYSAPFPIRDYRGDSLMLSDIALGLPGAETGWERKGATLALLPASQFPSSSFDVYYEVYNLPAGRPYATEIAVEPVGEAEGGEDRAVHTGFAGEAASEPDGVLPELRRVDASLDEGTYRLTVTVTDESTGATARRSRTFRVRGWLPGATMVPAIPRKPGSGAAG